MLVPVGAAIARGITSRSSSPVTQIVCAPAAATASHTAATAAGVICPAGLRTCRVRPRAATTSATSGRVGARSVLPSTIATCGAHPACASVAVTTSPTVCSGAPSTSRSGSTVG
jgi:hypothetical protein